MKKILYETLALVAAAALLLTGCATNKQQRRDGAPRRKLRHRPPLRRKRPLPGGVRRRGNRTEGRDHGHRLHLGRTLVSALADLFMERTGVTIAVQGTASAGIKAATDGSAALGMSSRELKERRKRGSIPPRSAWTGIAVVVNKENHRRQPDQGSDRSDLQGARSPTGRDVGGPDEEILLVSTKPAPAPAAPLKRSAADRKERRRQRGLPRGREQAPSSPTPPTRFPPRFPPKKNAIGYISPRLL